MNRKSQTTLEFVIILTAVIFTTVILIAFMRGVVFEKNKERINLAFINVVSQVKNEVDLASTSGDGYQREFSVPEKVFGFDYTINITENLLIATSSDGTYYVSQHVPEITGNVVKGTNIIRKQGGVVYLNI